MRAVLNPHALPFLDDLREFTRVRTFVEILASTVDEDEDYRRFVD